jgi:purine catabolism regulator
MPLTLREAMSLVEPLRKSRILAGANGLDNVVKSVNVMEVPDILEWVNPGQLLVTTMYPLRDKAAAVETLVPRLHEKGLAGLAVTPSEYIDDFPQQMLDAADKLGFPVIELPEKVSFIDIIQPLTSKILKLQSDELIESDRIRRQFIDLVLSGGRYSDIAQGIAQQVGFSVSIIDRFRRVLGNGLIMTLPQVQQVFMRDDGRGDVYLNDLYAPDEIGQISGSKARRIRVETEGELLDLVACSIRVGPMILGEIIIWGALAEHPRSTDLLAIEHGSTVVALKMMENRSISEVEARFRNEILQGLLSNQEPSRQKAIRLSQELGNRLNPPFVVILVGPDLPSGTPLPKTQAHEQSNIDSSLHLVQRYMRQIEPECSFWYQGSRLVIFFPVRLERKDELKGWLVQEFSRVAERVLAENAPYGVAMGISPTTKSLNKFRMAYECARQSLEIGAALESESSQDITHYEDLGLFRIISLDESASNLQSFCVDMLAPLLDYDREHGSELVKTLRIYLENNQNLARTAKALFIHYNTIRYRLDRIREIIGDAIDHPQQRLSLEIALQLLPHLERSLQFPQLD